MAQMLLSENDLAELNLTDEDLKDPAVRKNAEMLLEVIREEKRRRCKEDLLFLAHEVLGFKDLWAEVGDNDHPYRVIEHMLDRRVDCGYDKPFNLIMIPRDCLKTTLATVTKTIQRILRDGNVRILLTAATLDLSRKMLAQIKDLLTNNPKMVELWGNLKGRVWREHEITVAHRNLNLKEMTVEIGSPDNTKTSKHYDFIVADDLVTRANILTTESKYAIYVYFQDLLDILDHPHGVIDIIGTRWDFGDMYSILLDPEKGHLQDLNVLILGALDDMMQPVFPWKLSADRIEWLKRNKDALEFSAQYMNNPVPAADAVFKAQYFERPGNKYDKTAIDGDNLATYLLLDPAATKNKKSDYSAAVVVKVDEKGNWLVWDIFNDKLVPGKLEKKLYSWMCKYAPMITGIEQVGFAAYIGKGLEDLMRENKRFFRVVKLEPKGRAKEDRILGLEPLFRYGNIKFPIGGIKYSTDEGKELDMVYAMKEQFLTFPSSKKKDLMDVLAYGIDIIKTGILEQNIVEDARSKMSLTWQAELEDRRRQIGEDANVQAKYIDFDDTEEAQYV